VRWEFFTVDGLEADLPGAEKMSAMHPKADIH